MSDFVNIQATRVSEQIDNIYNQGKAYSWVRETMVNSKQAGATRVHFGTEWEAARQAGIHRRTIVDDGVGMDSSELRKYFNSFGGSGNAALGEGNFGYGAKLSLLPWNPLGVVVISRKIRTDNSVSSSMIWMKRGESGYGSRTFSLEEEGENGELYETNDSVVTLSDFDSFLVEESYILENGEEKTFTIDWVSVADGALGNQTAGTAIILLGSLAGIRNSNNYPDNLSTARFSDLYYGETAKYGIRQYISNHFYDLPFEYGRVTQDEFKDFSNPSTYPKDKGDTHLYGVAKMDCLSTSILSPRHLVAGGKPQRGELYVQSERTGMSARVEWYFVGEVNESAISKKDGTINTTSGDRTSYPITAAAFSLHAGVNEVFDLEASGIAGVSKNSPSSGRIASVVRVPEVAKRCAFIFYPIVNLDKGLTVQSSNSARSSLSVRTPLLNGTEPLPWDEWISELRRSLPDVIQKEIIRVQSEKMDSNGISIDPRTLRNIAAQYLPLFKTKFTSIVPSANGAIHGHIDPESKVKASRKNSKPKESTGGNGADLRDTASRETMTESPDGDVLGVHKTLKGGVVKVFLNEEEESLHIASWTGYPNLATLYSRSADFTRILTAFRDKAVELDRIDADEREDSALSLRLRSILVETMMVHLTCAASDIAASFKNMKDRNAQVSRIFGADMEGVKKYTPEDFASVETDILLSASLRGVKHIVDASWEKLTRDPLFPTGAGKRALSKEEGK